MKRSVRVKSKRLSRIAKPDAVRQKLEHLRMFSVRKPEDCGVRRTAFQNFRLKTNLNASIRSGIQRTCKIGDLTI